MKYSKFCSISLERLVNHKPPISEEWHAFALCNEKEMMTFEDINYSKLFLKKQKLNKQKLGIMKIVGELDMIQWAGGCSQLSIICMKTSFEGNEKKTQYNYTGYLISKCGISKLDIYF